MFVRERRDVTDSARRKVSVGRDVKLQTVQGGKCSVGRVVMFQTVQGEIIRSEETWKGESGRSGET